MSYNDRLREAYGNSSTGLRAQLEKDRRRLDVAIKALRRIAEGNLGDAPWQGNYEDVRRVALEALKDALR